MTVRAFDITFKDEAVQTVNLKAGTWTFHAFVNALTYSIGLKDSTGVWHNYDLSDQTGAGWYDVQETITTDFDAVEISLLNNAGTAQVLFPMFEKGSRKSVKRPHEKDIEEAAIIKSASWEIHTSSPVIYKDAPDLTTDGAHTPVTVTGRHWVGSVMTEEGFLTVTANDETEAANASPSPVTIAPLNSADKHTYTIRLYIDANKTELLDYETIPVVFKGAKGINAIRLHINNPVDVLPADSAGNVLSFTGTGTSIHVFEGAVELDYDGAGTANGKFKVTAVPSNITMGAITDSGNVCVVADATAMAAEKASIVYTVTGKTLDGFDFTVSGEQNFTKTNRGADGDGITGTTIEYAKDASGTTPPNTGWSVNLPTTTMGWYLWTRTTTTYKIAASTVAYSVSRWAKDGDGLKHVYRQSLSKPYIPNTGDLYPTGWSDSPDFSRTINSVTSWTLTDGWYKSSVITHGQSTTSRLTFTTTKPNQSIMIKIWGDSEINDYMMCGRLDEAFDPSFSNYRTRVSNGQNLTPTYEITLPGEHFIEFAYKKDASVSSLTDAGYFTVVPVDTTWITTCRIVEGIGQAWSDPVIFIPDTNTEERIYCLGKTETFPVISGSEPHINDYIPKPYNPNDFAGAFVAYTAYAIGKVVEYQLNYYKVIVATTSSYSGNPTDETYFVLLKKWTDNPTGATSGYPFEFMAIRNKVSGLWGSWTISIWRNYAKDGTGVDSLRTEYYLSTSSTAQTGGTWQTTVPVWVAGTYIWERIVTVMSDLTEVFGNPYLSRTWETINQLQADIIEEQAKTQFQTTTDGGLIYTALMKLFNPSSGSETAGISGNTSLPTNPAFYAGGTYADALNNLAKAIIRHDGTVKFADAEITGVINALSGKVGVLTIEESGRVILTDPDTHAVRLVFSEFDIPLIADLVSGANDGGSESNAAQSNITVGYLLQNAITVGKNNSSIAFSASQFTVNANIANMMDYITVNVYLRKNGVNFTTIKSVQLYGPGAKSENTSITYGVDGVGTGTYDVFIEITKTNTLDTVSSYISASTLSWTYTQAGIRYFQFGVNGMMAFFSDNHWYFTETGGFDLKGKTNMPGVLAAGSSTSGGTQTNVWGAKSDSSGVTPISGGFRIPLKNMTHSNYVVQITPHTNVTFRVSTKASTYFEILGSGGFDYVVIGNNY